MINNSIITKIGAIMKEKFFDLAELMDVWRVVPRLLLLAYGYLVWHVVKWYMTIPDPTSSQTTLVTVIAGLSTAVIGLYQSSGRNWLDYRLKTRILNEKKSPD
jgi:hypothetical protein